MSEKVIGYTLLAFGVVVILFAGLSTYRVFTKVDKPISIITNTQTEVSEKPKTQVIQGVEVQMPNFNDLIGMSPEMLIYITNLTIHLFLMGFIVNIGFKIATIGTQLVRPIVVDLRAKNLPKEISNPQ